MMKMCKKCGKDLPNWVTIDGERKNISSRKYCFDCSPWGKHNTKKLEKKGLELLENNEKQCSKCGKVKKTLEFHRKNTEGRFSSWCKQCLYDSQKIRWKDRKRKAISLFGGKCGKCGYDKNLACLDFHHLDPSQKKEGWKTLRLKSWDKIVKELKKCILLCCRCHRELHSPDWNLVFEESNKSNCLSMKNDENRLKQTGICTECGSFVYGTKYCCRDCADRGRRACERPSKTKLQELIENSSWISIGKKYGVSDSAVRKWAK